MQEIYSLLFPVYAILALGYFVGYRQWISEESEKGMIFFVFNIAVPCLILSRMGTLGKSPFPDTSVFLIVYGSIIGLWIFSGVCLILWGGRSVSAAIICGAGAIFGNVTAMGIPLSVSLLSVESSLHYLLILSVHGLILLPIMTLSCEALLGDQKSFAQILQRLFKQIAHNPPLLALMLGGSLFAVGLQLPEIFITTLEFPAAAVAPCGMFVVGAELSRIRLRGRLKQTFFVVSIKTLCLPLLVMFLGMSFGVSSDWLIPAVLLCSMPLGLMPYIYSRNYDVGVKLISSSFVLSYITSPLTIGFILYFSGY